VRRRGTATVSAMGPESHNSALTETRFDRQVDDMVVVMDETLRPEACGIAAQLRAAGRRVDLVLQAKKMKWVFKTAERCAPVAPCKDI